MRSIKALALPALILPVLIAACGGPPANNSVLNSPASSPEVPGSAASPAPRAGLSEGAKLYADNCAVCHKESGEGGVVEIEGKKIESDDLSSEKIKSFSDDKIRRYIVNGVPDEGMPAFKDKLSESQINSIVRYIRSDIQKMAAAPQQTPSGPPAG